MGSTWMASIGGDATQGNATGAASRPDHLAGHAFYLLIEDAGRELDARVLIACRLLERGAEVWIGQQLWFARNFAALKPGVALFKGNNMPQVANMRAARLSGHRTASIDEEMFGLVDASGERIHDPRAARHCDLFLAQGEIQQAFLESELRVSPDQIRIVGNPRADLPRAPARAAIDGPARDIRARIGPFVLINSNVSAVNPHDQDTYNYYRRCLAIKAVDQDDPKSIETFHAFCAFDFGNLRAIAAFIAAFRALAPDRKIVLRPHPAENPSSWRQAYDDDPNVAVVEDSRHLAWIRAADALVHTSCTTGFEGFLMGTRTVGLVPDPDNPYSKHYLSNLVGEIHQDPAAAARALIAPASAPRIGMPVIDAILRIDPNESATTKVVDALGDLAATLASDPSSKHTREDFLGFTPNQRQKNQMSVDRDQLRSRLDTLGSAIGFPHQARIETIDRDVFHLYLSSRQPAGTA